MQSGFEFLIHERCPSVQGRNVGIRLAEWRGYICDMLFEKGFMAKRYRTAEENIRRFILKFLNGRCCFETAFYFRTTKR